MTKKERVMMQVAGVSISSNSTLKISISMPSCEIFKKVRLCIRTSECQGCFVVL